MLCAAIDFLLFLLRKPPILSQCILDDLCGEPCVPSNLLRPRPWLATVLLRTIVHRDYYSGGHRRVIGPGWGSDCRGVQLEQEVPWVHHPWARGLAQG